MAGTLVDLRQQVYDRLGVPTSDPQFPTALVTRVVNDALHEFELEHDWPWAFTSETLALVAGTDTYNVASNLRRSRWLRISDDYQLDRYPLNELLDRWSDADRGRPAEYAIENTSIVVRPTPDASYSAVHRYVRRETTLAADGDTPLVPIEFQPAIAELATVIALRRSRDDARAVGAQAAYDRWLNAMRDDTRRYRAPGRVRVRPGGWG